METQNGDAMEHSGNDTATTSPDDERKLFIGGLSWETTEANLKEFFSKFGEVDNVNLKTDPNTGRSRGFAFVVFKSSESVEGVLSSGDLTIQNKKVEAKRAKARQGKVFVGGLPAEVSEDDIKAHFGTYGKIVLMEMPFDKVRNQRKGFCFITFESENSMKNLLQSPKQVVGGKEVDVKKATPRNDQMGGMGGGFMRGAPRGAPRGGMMRGGRGGMAIRATTTATEVATVMATKAMVKLRAEGVAPPGVPVVAARAVAAASNHIKPPPLSCPTSAYAAPAGKSASSTDYVCSFFKFCTLSL
ncbi:unnamed protein product [Notodromas monacha]|uniref:RRM domain-containing protein n=1 Tax=Notodromas monacha TaxID=399045 RepID=A0A7R9BMS5_9CRUS|nr:unnamed protein product [Notodromas monacha]CAG0917559.1 unnamed protein product [Notodromas monacha]